MPKDISNGVKKPAQKQTIVSGIRASGKLHLGNYLGALKQFIQLQNESKNECFFFIADLHALTTPFEPKELSQNTLEVAAEYLAAGIDPDKSTFFLQNHVHQHSELAWIFNCLTPIGELERMTQFKDKSSQQSESINAGLLTYPCLMAADILLYKPQFVPVGDDQTQHLELTRAIAKKFNNRFGKTFPEPKNIMMNPLRVMSLTDPTKKMSKTPHQPAPLRGARPGSKFGAGQAGDEALMLDDNPEEILRKLKRAVTATDAKQDSPGVANLFLILEHLGNKKDFDSFKKAQADNTIKYSELKEYLAKIIAQHFADFREKKQTLLANKKQTTEILQAGAAKATKIAQQTLDEVKEKIGLLNHV